MSLGTISSNYDLGLQMILVSLGIFRGFLVYVGVFLDYTKL